MIICPFEHRLILRFSTANVVIRHRVRRAWAPHPALAPLARLGSKLPAHVELAHLDPCGAVHDAVHDRVGVHAAPEPCVPVLLSELGAEHRRA